MEDGWMSLQELAENCKEMYRKYGATKACYKCECSEFCFSYSNFMKRVDPVYWTHGKPLPNVLFDRSGFYKRSWDE